MNRQISIKFCICIDIYIYDLHLSNYILLFLIFQLSYGLDLCTKCVSPKYLPNKWLHFEKILLVLSKFKIPKMSAVAWYLGSYSFYCCCCWEMGDVWHITQLRGVWSKECHNVHRMWLFIPPQTLFVVGYTVFTLSVHPSVRPYVCPWHFGFFLIPWKRSEGYSSISTDTLISIRCTYIRKRIG